MMPRYLALPLLLLAPAAARADGAALARAVAPYLDDGTLAVAHLDLASLDADDVTDALVWVTGFDRSDLEPGRAKLRAWLADFRRAGGGDVFVVLSAAGLLDGPFVVAPCADGGDVKAVARLLGELGPGADAAQPVGQAAVVASPARLARLRRQARPGRCPDLAEALDAVDGPLRLVLVPDADTRRVVEELLPTLPPSLGGGPVKALTRGARLAAVGVGVKPPRLRLAVQTTDEAAARDAQVALARVVRALAEQKAVRDLWPDANALPALLVPRQEGARLTYTVEAKELAEVLRPAAARARVAAERARSENNLRQLAVALHTYHDAHGSFPAAASYDGQGRPLLSWRVHLLPFVEQDALYREFRLDEPWDSPHNRKLIARMPAVFASSPDPRLAAAGKTTYLAPRGDATVFPGRQAVRMRDILDGVSNTILLVDADDARAVEWTRPDDLPFDPQAPSAGLAFRVGDAALVVLADGAVRALPRSLKKEAWKALFTRNGGEPLDDW
jgi:hypothetical protein